MTKHTLINKKTKKQHICVEIEIEGDKYYVPYASTTHLNQDLQEGDWVYSSLYGLGRVIKDVSNSQSIVVKYEKAVAQQQYHKTGVWKRDKYYDIFAHNCKKIVATDNPNIEIPKIVNEVNEALESVYAKEAAGSSLLRIGFARGYELSQETHPFSENDMVEFAKWIADSSLHGHTKQMYEAIIKYKLNSIEELVQYWNKNKSKILYFE